MTCFCARRCLFGVAVIAPVLKFLVVLIYLQQQQLFYGPLSRTTRVSPYQKKHSPTHHPDHHPVFISFFHLLRSIASSLFKLCVFFHKLSQCPLWSTSWSGAFHLIRCISSPSQCLLFAAHAHTITTCFAVVPRLYHLFLVFLSDPYL